MGRHRHEDFLYSHQSHGDTELVNSHATTNLTKTVAKLSDRVNTVTKESNAEPWVHQDESRPRHFRSQSRFYDPHHHESRHPHFDRNSDTDSPACGIIRLASRAKKSRHCVIPSAVLTRKTLTVYHVIRRLFRLRRKTSQWDTSGGYLTVWTLDSTTF